MSTLQQAKSFADKKECQFEITYSEVEGLWTAKFWAYGAYAMVNGEKVLMDSESESSNAGWAISRAIQNYRDLERYIQRNGKVGLGND